MHHVIFLRLIINFINFGDLNADLALDKQETALFFPGESATNLGTLEKKA